MSVSRKTLQHPILTLIVFVLFGILGAFSLKNIALSLMPDMDNPFLMVSTSYTNAGPESVEKAVTKVLEGQLISVSGLKKLSSNSSEGSSMIFLEFNYGTNLDVATNNVRDKIGRVTKILPDECSTPTIIKMDSDSRPIMQIAVKGQRSRDDLKIIAEDNIVDLLEQTEGVAEATVNGGRQKIVRVELNQNRLAAYGLTISSVNSALSKQNLELGGGKITEGVTDYTIRTTGEFSSLQQIRDTVITKKNDYIVKLSDIGTAELGYEDKSNEVYINGLPGIYVSVTKQSGKNSVTVANAVYEKMEQIRENLPGDVEMEVISDETDSIRDTIDTLLDSCYEGLLLAVIVLFLFLKNFKSTMIIGISIPLSLVVTMFFMSVTGLTLNMMTLTGLILGVGMIVDASIVIIENIYVYRSRGAKAKVAAELGSAEMTMSVISGNLTTICVFIPFLFFMKDLGFMGQMFKGIIFTVVIALVCSLFVAIFLVPVLAGKFLPLTNRKEKPVKFKPLRKFYELLDIPLNLITKLYRKVLKAALAHRILTVLICVCVLVISFSFAPDMKITMMHMGNDDSVKVSITLPIGTTLSETTQVVQDFERICREEINGYKNIITSIGTGRGSSNAYKGSIEIKLPDSDQQIDTSSDIQEKLRPHFNDYAGVKFNFGDGMMRQMAGSDLKIKVRSDSLDDALDVATKITESMKKIPSIGEPVIDTEEGVPEVEVVIDRNRAYDFGVDVSTVAREINYAMNGVNCTTFRDNGKEYSVKLMYQDQDRTKVIDLEQIYINGSQGKVCVANFAEVKKGLGPVTIRRENQTRVVTVSANIITTDNSYDVENLLKKQIDEDFIVPTNVHLLYDGAWKNMQEQGNTYMLIILMAVILVFGVMAGTYESFKAPVINLFTIPFVIIGVIGIYQITGQTFSMVSAVGIIMLVGIVVNNGIILVDYTNLLMDRGLEIKEACLKAGTSRLRPVLMTTLTTILGMIPLCFTEGGSSGIVQPIGVAVVGGLTSSTFITLFLIPVLYSLIMKKGKQKKSHIKVFFEGNNRETKTDEECKSEVLTEELVSETKEQQKNFQED